MSDRAFVIGSSAVLGALIGVVAWWIVGLGLGSSALSGEVTDPALLHWVVPYAVGFGLYGLRSQDGVIALFWELCSVLFGYEHDQPTYSRTALEFALLVVMVIGCGAVAAWFDTR